VIVDGCIYVLGGYLSWNGYCKNVKKLETHDMRTWVDEKNMLEKRAYHAATYMNGTYLPTCSNE